MENQYFQSEIHRLLKLGPDLAKPYQPEPTPEPVAVIQDGPATAFVAEDVADVTRLGNAPFDLPYHMDPPRSADDIVPRFAPMQATAQGAAGLDDLPNFLTPPRELSSATAAKPKAKPAKSGRGAGSLLVYPLVFALSFGFFYVVLNFSALMLQVQGWFAKD